MTQQTDRELIQHLVNELQGYRVAHPDHEMPALEAGRTRLAQPESEGPTDEDAVEACPFDSFHEPAEYHGWWSAIEWAKQHQCSPTIEPEGTADEAWQEFIEQVQHVQHVASREGEGPRFDLVECALALWREAIPPAPEPVELPPGYIDAEHTGRDREMLEAFYKACRSEGGTADEVNLRGLKDVLSRWGRPAIEPVPVAERPWEREGWCDAEGRCWWGRVEGNPGNPEWFLAGLSEIEGFYEIGDWIVLLPHHALPVPGAEVRQ